MDGSTRPFHFSTIMLSVTCRNAQKGIETIEEWTTA
jgi:hypothetical protein